MTPEAPIAEKPQLFDVREPFAIEIESGGIRTCRLKFPPDQQWIERSRKIVLHRDEIAGGKTKMRVLEIEKIDEPFFRKALLPDPPDNGQNFDEFEASLALEILSRCDVESGEKADGAITVTARVFGNRSVTHVFQLPRRRHVIEYKRGSLDIVSGTKTTEFKAYLGPSAIFYDALIVSHEGYAEGSQVPILHKDAVVTEVLRLVNEVPQAQGPGERA